MVNYGVSLRCTRSSPTRIASSYFSRPSTKHLPGVPEKYTNSEDTIRHGYPIKYSYRILKPLAYEMPPMQPNAQPLPQCDFTIPTVALSPTISDLRILVTSEVEKLFSCCTTVRLWRDRRTWRGRISGRSTSCTKLAQFRKSKPDLCLAGDRSPGDSPTQRTHFRRP